MTVQINLVHDSYYCDTIRLMMDSPFAPFLDAHLQSSNYYNIVKLFFYQTLNSQQSIDPRINQLGGIIAALLPDYTNATNMNKTMLTYLVDPTNNIYLIDYINTSCNISCTANSCYTCLIVRALALPTSSWSNRVNTAKKIYDALIYADQGLITDCMQALIASNGTPDVIAQALSQCPPTSQCGVSVCNKTPYDGGSDTCWIIENSTPAPLGIFSNKVFSHFESNSLTPVYQWMENDTYWIPVIGIHSVTTIKTSWLAEHGCGNPDEFMWTNDPLCYAIMIPGATSSSTPYTGHFLDKGSLLYNSLGTCGKASSGSAYIATPTGEPFENQIVNSQFKSTYPSHQICLNSDSSIGATCTYPIENFNSVNYLINETSSTTYPLWANPCAQNAAVTYSFTRTINPTDSGNVVNLKITVNKTWS